MKVANTVGQGLAVIKDFKGKGEGRQRKGRMLDNTPSHKGPELGVVVARKHARRRRWDVENFQASRSFRLVFLDNFSC